MICKNWVVVSALAFVAGYASPTPSASAQVSPELSVAVRAVATNVRPAVVQITTQQMQLDQFNQPFTVPAGVGSGFIYDRQGHILTNDHVVEGASSLLVALPDGRSFPGTVVGTDPVTDLGVVQINGDNLPVAALGQASELQVGDWVVAIGNALALPGGPTVTQGVVSALNRSVQEPGTAQAGGPLLVGLVQTDAPINPGNSGGPLANLQSQVVGINTLVAGQAEPGVQSQGIGFAISIDTARQIADQLVSTGHAVHPYIGISFAPLTPSLARQLGTGAHSGVVVAQVVAASPAAQAGLQRGDVITAVDQQTLETDTALAEILASHNVGDTLTLSVQRGPQPLQLTLTLAAHP
jgi:S1-C subfamily serine protease